MEDETVDPLEINKDPQLIKVAQADIGKLDVLVCGSCHDVFHFIEQFQEHKSPGNCSGTSVIKDNYQHEPKPQVWAFMLWKNAQYKNGNESKPVPSSWVVYQRWCKLEPKEKEAWIVAGRNIQSFTKLGAAQMQEVRVKPQIVGKKGTPNRNILVTVPSLTGKTVNDDDPLEEGEIRLSQLTEAQRVALTAQTEVNKQSDDADPLRGIDSEMDTEEKNADDDKNTIKTDDTIKKGIMKPVQLNSDVTILPTSKKTGNTKAIRTSKNDKNEEYVVEKILSKRYNPRKKTFEYMIKWENFEKGESTWEPTANLQSCKAMLDEFEVHLQKQKSEKVKAASLQQKLDKKSAKSGSLKVELTPRGRPQRTSKQKALNQVKVWCGDISDADNSSSKRKHSDDDSDSDSFEKKMKLEEESDSSDEDQKAVKPTITIKKVGKTGVLNGVGGKPPHPDKILIPDSQGIVRINQKQASELSSGVYIMSKTAGIIKLDSNTSKLATSGGQTIVKVAPKIGQTQIRVVKKDPQSNIIRITPKASPRSKQTLKATPKTYSKKDQAAAKVVSSVEKIFDPEPEEDESDGIPELEFPTDLPLPEPESPPGEFTLDPLTGKIAGQEYPEMPEEPIVKKDETTEAKTEHRLENLVELAAADILEDELRKITEDEKESEVVKIEPENGQKPENGHQEAESNKSTTKVKATPSQIVTAAPTPKPVFKTKSASASNVSTSTPKTGTSILQKKLLSTPNLPRNSPANRKPNTPQVAMPIKNVTPSPARNRNISPKGKIGLPSYPPTITRVRQSYSNKNLSIAKKIGQTTIYRTKPVAPKKPVEKKPVVLNTAPTNVPVLSIKDNGAAEAQPVQTGLAADAFADLTSLAELSDAETPLLITGEDGTIYQVAGQDEQGQTILISQSADGQSQCLVVATESQQLEDSQQLVEMPEELQEAVGVVDEEDAAAENADETQVVAQLISADPPSPGGKRNVTVMLPDGSCVTMSVTQEQYESLELDK